MGADQSDAELLAAITDGDRDALRVLYERQAGWLVVRLSHASNK
jgi:hypothetical protein